MQKKKQPNLDQNIVLKRFSLTVSSKLKNTFLRYHNH